MTRTPTDDGFVRVPRESSAAMEDAGLAALSAADFAQVRQGRRNEMAKIYAAMLAAAPTPPNLRTTPESAERGEVTAAVLRVYHRGGEFFPVQVTDYARGRMDAALAPLLEREKALVAENERLKAGRLLDCNEEAGPIVPCEVCPGLRTDAAWEAAESELATARADNACLAAEVERLKGELAEARKAPAEVAVTEAMVRRFVEEANPMIHPLPPPGVVRSALQAALASRDEPTKGRG